MPKLRAAMHLDTVFTFATERRDRLPGHRRSIATSRCVPRAPGIEYRERDPF